MGLDITAYSHMELLPPHVFEDGCYEEGHVNVFAQSDFPGRDEGLVPDRCYGPTSGTEVHDFRAGSYSGYGQWRTWLSHWALGVPPETVWRDWGFFGGKPFAELIHFYDNEGYIGPVVAAKLAEDFEKNEPPQPVDYLSGWVDRYRDWTKAFQLARDDGLVEFH